jgi:hypothetical protein
MSHVNIFRTDYGHLLEIQVDEIDELTGIKSPANLALYSSITVIARKPSDTLVYLPATASGVNYVNALIPSGFFSETGHYSFDTLLENELQRFHSTEFGLDIVIPMEE